MNKAISILRIAILFAVFGIGMLFLFGEEQDESNVAFFFHFIFDKALAFGAGYLTYVLYRRWSKSDKLIAAYDRWSIKGLEDEE